VVSGALIRHKGLRREANNREYQRCGVLPSAGILAEPRLLVRLYRLRKSPSVSMSRRARG